MIVDQSLREELIKEFVDFSKAGESVSCFDEWIYLNNKSLYFAMIERLQRDCRSCTILFPKLRTYTYYDHGHLLDGTAFCMCHFLKTEDFQASVEKAWRYINGEWG
jgi:hypothetical protein